MRAITWKRIDDRAQAPFRGDEQLPFSVCSYGPTSDRRYEAWDKRGAWAACIRTGLATPDEAKALVMAEIERSGL